MPGDNEVSRGKAAGLIRNRPDWPRDNSIGFVEFGFNGMANDETQPTRIDVEIVGGPRRTAPLPKG